MNDCFIKRVLLWQIVTKPSDSGEFGVSCTLSEQKNVCLILFLEYTPPQHSLCHICRELDCVRRLTSFRKHVESLELEQQAEVLTSESAAKTEIAKLLKQLQQQVAKTVTWLQVFISSHIFFRMSSSKKMSWARTLASICLRPHCYLCMKWPHSNHWQCEITSWDPLPWSTVAFMRWCKKQNKKSFLKYWSWGSILANPPKKKKTQGQKFDKVFLSWDINPQ